MKGEGWFHVEFILEKKHLNPLEKHLSSSSLEIKAHQISPTYKFPASKTHTMQIRASKQGCAGVWPVHLLGPDTVIQVSDNRWNLGSQLLLVSQAKVIFYA